MANYILESSFIFLWIAVVCEAQFFVPPIATKAVAGIDAKDVRVECYSDGLKVFIEKSRLPWIRSSENLHFLDPACIAGENDTHFIASTSYRSCGVTRKVQWNGMIYSNTLMTGFPETDDFDYKCPVISVKFTCVHSFFVWPKPRMTRAVAKYINCEHIVALGPKIKQGIVTRMRAKSGKIRMRSRVMSCPMVIGIGPPVQSGVYARVHVKSKGFKVKRTHAFVCSPLKGTYTYDMELKAYHDYGYSNPIENVFYIKHASVEVYYELKLKTSNSFLTIYPKRCYATPFADPMHKLQYTFIKDGCFMDDSVQLYKSDRNAFRFSIQTFQFVGIKDPKFYVHCDVSICDVEDGESFCAQGCKNKVKRRRRTGSKRRRINTGFVKKCKFEMIQVAIRRTMLRTATQNNLQLEDPNCLANVNETHFSFNIKRGKCGTLAKQSGTTIEISNSVNYRIDGTQVFSVPVKCKYTENRGSSLAERSFKVANRERYVSVSLSPSYHFNKKVVLDPGVAEVFSHMPLSINARELQGILDVSIASFDKNLEFVIDHCKVKPSATSKRKRLLIENDCAVDDRVFLHKRNTTSRLFIDFKKWKMPGNRLFAKCHFTVCHRNSPSTKCRRKACEDKVDLSSGGRRRRSTRYANLKASVSCNPDLIKVALQKKSVPTLRAKDLHLREESCKATENSTHIILETKPSSCRTTVKSFGQAIEYSNIILKETKILSGIIRRFSRFRLPVKCIFVPTTVKRHKPAFKATKALIRFSGISTGTYSVRLKLYTNEFFNQEMDFTNARMNPGSELFFQVGMEAPNASVAIYLETCYGKPFFSTDARERYTFIKDDCPVDGTVRFYESGRIDKKRFSLSPFEFSNALYKSVFVNCIISACDPKDQNSRCRKGCSDSFII
eukprot:Seg2133.4 transcript_id=Seg2133.4/GoldUCD/mRNA.D3Y31 product="ZP domain-containing protein" protein_id=Seg2133.4/GoldUCD/D3Y31